MEDHPGIARRELPKGQRVLEMSFGPMTVQVVEIPASVMPREEWKHIQRSRMSYGMWGGKKTLDRVVEDPFDGLALDSLYNTYHYLATITAPGRASKYLTMRKVGMKPRAKAVNGGMDTMLPEDVTFWQVHDQASGGRRPFAQVLRDVVCAGRFGSPSVDAALQICAINRSGTYFAESPDLLPMSKEGTAIAFALIQIAVTDRDDYALFVNQICLEFQEKALSIRDMDDRLVMLDFARTGDTLQLPPEQCLRLDNGNASVREVKLCSPGYWVDNTGAARVIKALAGAGRLSLDDLAPACRELSCSGAEIPASFEKVVDLLVQPKNFRYLIELMHTRGNLNARLSGDELRERLIHEAGDGPFSSTLVPGRWRRSALDLLSAAHEKYAQ
jgi:hypothetical protein